MINNVRGSRGLVICCSATYIGVMLPYNNEELTFLNRRNNMEKLFQIPAYSEVKTFWSNYFGNVQKFYTDFAEDIVKSFKK